MLMEDSQKEQPKHAHLLYKGYLRSCIGSDIQNRHLPKWWYLYCMYTRPNSCVDIGLKRAEGSRESASIHGLCMANPSCYSFKRTMHNKPGCLDLAYSLRWWWEWLVPTQSPTMNLLMMLEMSHLWTSLGQSHLLVMPRLTACHLSQLILYTACHQQLTIWSHMMLRFAARHWPTLIP